MTLTSSGEQKLVGKKAISLNSACGLNLFLFYYFFVHSHAWMVIFFFFFQSSNFPSSVKKIFLDYLQSVIF